MLAVISKMNTVNTKQKGITHDRGRLNNKDDSPKESPELMKWTGFPPCLTSNVPSMTSYIDSPMSPSSYTT